MTDLTGEEMEVEVDRYEHTHMHRQRKTEMMNRFLA